MPAETAVSLHPADASHKSTFFRQSGWMMIATVVGGMFMSFIHILSKKLPASEYSAFGTLLQVVNWVGIPAIGLQMVFAQQTSAVVTENQRRQLVGTLKAVMLWTFCLWVVMALVTLVCQTQVVAGLHLSKPSALWLTLMVGFMMLWFPIVQGLLQGRQNFLWLGWTAIFNGVGRVLIGAVVVYALHGGAVGLMGGVLIGLAVAVSIGLWHNRDLFREPTAPFAVRDWLKRVLPLTIGFGVGQFLFSADLIVVHHYLTGAPGEGLDAPYVFGGTLARAIVLFTIPLASVMFPKLVHSAARSQKSNLMVVTLAGTAVLGCCAAIGLIVTAPFAIKYGSNPDYVSILPVMPLFAWAMVPLALANVLLYNLMAHSRFKITPVLLALAVSYWFALQHFHDSFKMVIQTFAVFNLIFLAVCALFTWGVDRQKNAEAD
jgi:O-antigen/teichoic acid export membrane protein